MSCIFFSFLVGPEKRSVDSFVYPGKTRLPDFCQSISSDSSWEHLHEWPQYARNAALLVDPPVMAFNLHLPGAGHFSLTDLVLVSPRLVRFLEGEAPSREGIEYLQAVNQACLEFLNHHLK